MIPALTTRFATLAIAALLVGTAPLHAATTEPMDIDPDMQAKVAREKAKARYERGVKNTDTRNKRDNDSSDCGSINIGNSDDEQKGSRKIAPREKNVIITGPVINAGNCR